MVPFTNASAPGRKNFDVDINQVTITEERRQAVDFSSGYYDVAQTVITAKGSKIDGATTIAALKDATLGAQVGTSSYTAITDQIQPTAQPAGYGTINAAGQALSFGHVDGLVVNPAHRVLPHHGAARRRRDRRAAAGPDGHRGPVRHGAGQGQPDHPLRECGRGRAPRRRHPRQAGEAVADRHGRRANPDLNRTQHTYIILTGLDEAVTDVDL